MEFKHWINYGSIISKRLPYCGWDFFYIFGTSLNIQKHQATAQSTPSVVYLGS